MGELPKRMGVGTGVLLVAALLFCGGGAPKKDLCGQAFDALEYMAGTMENSEIGNSRIKIPGTVDDNISTHPSVDFNGGKYGYLEVVDYLRNNCPNYEVSFTGTAKTSGVSITKKPHNTNITDILPSLSSKNFGLVLVTIVSTLGLACVPRGVRKLVVGY